MQRQTLGRKAALQGYIKLSRAGDIHAQPLTGDKRGHGRGQKRFACVVDLVFRVTRIKGRFISPAIGTNGGLIYNIKRRAKLFSQLYGIASANIQVAIFSNLLRSK